MEMSQRIEMLERAVVIVAATYTYDPDFSPEEQAETLERIVNTAKAQAMDDMETARQIELRRTS